MSDLKDFNIKDGVLVRYNGEDSDVVIPESVTSIGAYAFEDCTSLTSVVIPDSVTSINGAFIGCTSLTSVVIPESVTSIDYAFIGCTSLTSVVIPDSVTSINDAFRGCTSLTSVVIPDSVTSIGDWAFSYCQSLTSIVIPDSVTSIREYAFSGCASLTSVVIPDSVTSIIGAFSVCTSLTSVVISDSVTSIGGRAFRGCTSLTSIVIPESVTSIGEDAFSGCESLTSVVIPDSVTSIGESAFRNCTSLTNIVIPESVTSIGKDAFWGIKKIFIKDIGLLKSGDKPAALAGFVTCSSEYTEKQVEKYISYIKKNTMKLIIQAMEDVRLLKIMLENDCLVSEVVDEYIAEAERLNNIEAKAILFSLKESKEESDFELGDEVETFDIKGKTFVVTGKLKSINREDLKKYINAFGGKLVGSISSKTSYLICNDISSATKKVNEARSLGIKIISEKEFYDMFTENGWIIADGVLLKYVGENDAVIIPESVTSIGKDAFWGIKKIFIKDIGLLKSGDKPAAVAGFVTCSSEYTEKQVKKYISYIKKNAMKLIIQAMEDVRLLKIMLENDCLVSEVVDEYIAEAERLNNIEAKAILLSLKKSKEESDFELGDEVETFDIKDKTFVVTGELKSINREDLKKYINAFGGKLVGSISSKTSYLICNDISSATKKVNEARSLGIKVISEKEFYDMSAENGWAIADGVLIRYFGENDAVIIPESVTSIGENAFRYCTSLTSIEIPDSVTSIHGAFIGCTSLTSVVIPDSVTSINDAFRGCTSLTSVVIPDSVTSIGDYAFRGCISLTSVVIPDSVTSIGDYAFRNCTSLTNIVIPESVTSIGKDAFWGIKKIFIKDIGLLKSGDKPAALAGFATCFSEFQEKEKNNYLAYMKENASKLISLALNDIRLLNIMIENDCLIPEMVDEYIAEADRLNNIEAKAILLSINESKE